ncbi:hypothetical protein HOT57_gp71 [Pseudomonas phage phCDa]|uniref:Uncharacterized protein n=1 Tax=Pseudomonas phage phCDa TaxID=2268587 RepID=A0A2Z5H8X4_9CAUD|nr:hypothetical protein HOT57_gp71 [Pseudomonas phage phCDa]AXC36515.1 hypothetical protein phCDa_71 [Pseudomonas phage phCDa]
MNLQTLLPFVSSVVGRDVTAEAQMLNRGYEAVGKAMSPEGQKFIIGHWRGLADFMESPAGRDAIVGFVNAWIVGTYPQLAPPPKPEIPRLNLPEAPASQPEPPPSLLT